MTTSSKQPVGSRTRFDRLPGGYVYELLDEPLRIEVRHLRRDRGLHAEVDVQCEWAGVPRHNKSLSCADMNLSSQTARRTLAKFCAERAKTKPDDFDWQIAIDAACLEVIAAERDGVAAIVLDDALAEGPPQDFTVHGLRIPADSHSMLIADGGGLKSLLIELVLGEMARRGIPVALLDWEWSAERHLARKKRLFGSARLDHFHYMPCRNPLSVEADHIRRFCAEAGIQFLGIDSISAACDGKLADDDVARAYNRALAELPPSLSAAHIPKGTLDPKADLKAFGSAFFHNFCRVSWTVKKQPGESEDVITAGLFPQKQNDGARLRPVGLEFTFSPERIAVRPVDLALVEGLAEKLPLAARMLHLLKNGPLTLAVLADELGGANVETLDRTVRRRSDLFTRVSTAADGITRIALVERRTA